MRVAGDPAVHDTDGDGRAEHDPTVTATPEPTVTVTEATTATPSPHRGHARPTRTRPKNQCPNSSLGVSVVPDPSGGAAGSEYYNAVHEHRRDLVALRGTPGVSVVGDGNGTQLGAAPRPDQTGVTTITLAVGERCPRTLEVVNIGTNGGPLEGCTVQER